MKEKTIRKASVMICEIFVVITILHLLAIRQYGSRLLLAFATIVMLFLPGMVEKLFSCKLRLPVYLFSLLYALGPMLGHCWELYYTLPGWDKVLHISGGILFALLGILIFERFCGNNRKVVAMAAAFALCFSMALSVAWEFYEFGCDTFLGTDMQNDTVITEIHSYFLADELGVAGSIVDIEEVTVNGQPLPVAGYLDIGLIDTMMDMLLEIIGSLAVVAIFIFSRGRIKGFDWTEHFSNNKP